MVVTTPRWADLANSVVGDSSSFEAAVYPGARVHVPTATIAEARCFAAEFAADGVLAIGGGSAIGLAKALAYYDALPYVALPTTLAGSEMTSIWGETEGGTKRTARDERVRPLHVVYDPELLESLPEMLLVQSALNALAHIVEATYSPRSSPLLRILAEAGAAALGRGLETLPSSRSEATAELLYGSLLAGMCLSSSNMAIHHKICHVVGGALDLPHAATHALVLPHVMALNLPAVPDAQRLIVRALGAPDPTQWATAALERCGAPTGFRALGVDQGELVALAPKVLEELGEPQANPVKVSLGDVEELLAATWAQ
jgi:maleylacetate reductase